MNLTSAVVKPTAASVYPRSMVCSTVPRYAVRSDVHGACHCARAAQLNPGVELQAQASPSKGVSQHNQYTTLPPTARKSAATHFSPHCLWSS